MAKERCGGAPVGIARFDDRLDELVLTPIVKDALWITGAEVGAVILVGMDDGGSFACILDAAGRRLPPPDTGAGLLRRRVATGADSSEQPPPRLLLPHASSSISVSVTDAGTTLGLIHVESRRSDAYAGGAEEVLSDLAHRAVPIFRRLFIKCRLRKGGAPVDLIGSSAKCLELERQILEVARASDGHVFITGERGSGKEVAAWSVHCCSCRLGRPFLPVLSSGLTETLFVDELFGHERYAFTGAAFARPGKFRTADGGSLFLDEVADLSLGVQSALLRVADTGEFTHIGADQSERVNVRVLSATNRNVDDLLHGSAFREDLYDRLSQFQLEVPPLRKRSEDIPALANYFLVSSCGGLQRRGRFPAECEECERTGSASCVRPAFFDALCEYHWPGNVRQLKTCVVRLTCGARDTLLTADHVHAQLRKTTTERSGVDSAPSGDRTLRTAIQMHILRVLDEADNNQARAARLLGIPVSTLRNAMKRYGVPRLDRSRHTRS